MKLYDDNTQLTFIEFFRISWSIGDGEKRNMNKLKLSLLLFFTFQLLAFAQEEPARIPQLEIPKTNPNDLVISHTGYSFLYNEYYEQSNWVAYELTKEETNKVYNRTNNFMPDPAVKTETANDGDYKGSGYDRGHLAPASDMGWSSISMAESFYYSNMSPQQPSFNRGIWKKLEELVRTWAVENNSIYIVTGPVLTIGLPTIGADKVAVPSYFYKVILDYSEPSIKGIGFLIPNAASSEPLQHYAVSIESIEKITGIDFFPLLPDGQEELIEKALCMECWSWISTKNKSIKKDNRDNSIFAIQCKGRTKSGKPCKHKTFNENGYCNLHQNQNEYQKYVRKWLLK